MMATVTTSVPELIAEGQTTEEAFLRQIFVRDQMAEWSKQPLVMSRADGVFYWDVEGERYFDAISGIYVASVGHNNRPVIDAIKRQLDVLEPPGFEFAFQLHVIFDDFDGHDDGGVRAP